MKIKEKVKNFLSSQRNGLTPTEIGMAIGYAYGSASSSVSQPLKSLVADGLVYKTKVDGKITYTFGKNPIKPKKEPLTNKPFNVSDIKNELHGDIMYIIMENGFLIKE